ncbi:MAG: ATP-binding protein [Gemmatimonadetes bacterium]|nr:ATP-binding protein [Gemmatimonadota bacterium]
MTSSTHTSPSGAPSTSTRVLDALAGIIAELAGERALETSLAASLESLRSALGAEEAAIWLLSAAGMVRAWGSGPEQVGGDAVRSIIADERWDSDGVVAARISGGEQRSGALVVRVTRALEPEERTLVSAVANILAPELAHAEKSRRLEVEVEVRTAEIDRERRFTDKIIDSLPVGLYVIDREFRIQAWNRKRETGMQGVSREEALGRTIFEILHRQPSDMLRREFDDVFATGRIQEYQMESLATGELRTYRISKIPMRLGDSGVTHVITIGEDVTDWKEAQTRFAHAEKLAAIGQLAAGVMHEINNPLATIAAIAESLQFKVDDAAKAGAVFSPDVHEYLHIIDNEVSRCKQIVDGLLDFSRPKLPLRERVDLNEVVQRTMLLLKHHVRFKRLTVNTELASDIPRVPKASAEQLVQVLMALLLNAMDAMVDRRGAVTIRTIRGPTAGEGVIAEVSDQGSGIPRSELTKIFEPFYTTKDAGKGTGLGLSICYGIVQDHGGRLEVDSVVGQGSTFRVFLPSVDL